MNEQNKQNQERKPNIVEGLIRNLANKGNDKSEENQKTDAIEQPKAEVAENSNQKDGAESDSLKEETPENNQEKEEQPKEEVLKEEKPIKDGVCCICYQDVVNKTCTNCGEKY